MANRNQTSRKRKDQSFGEIVAGRPGGGGYFGLDFGSVEIKRRRPFENRPPLLDPLTRENLHSFCLIFRCACDIAVYGILRYILHALFNTLWGIAVPWGVFFGCFILQM